MFRKHLLALVLILLSTLAANSQQQMNKINIKAGNRTLTATLVDNSSTRALLALLSNGPVEIHMNDYAGMEKVGSLPQSLPRNDTPMNTVPGDVILYQGRSFVIYYGTNSWSLTPLGKIDGNLSGTELLDILGDGSIDVELSLATGGVDDITADSASPLTVHRLDGTRLPVTDLGTLVPGLYIVNGKTRLIH